MVPLEELMTACEREGHACVYEERVRRYADEILVNMQRRFSSSKGSALDAILFAFRKHFERTTGRIRWSHDLHGKVDMSGYRGFARAQILPAARQLRLAGGTLLDEVLG